MRHLGSFRMYEPAIREMASRGHEVHLALGRAEALGWNTALENLLRDHPTITWSWLSPSTAAFWAELAKTIRLWADYLRYFQSEYASTPKLKARAEERVPPRLVAIANRPAFQDARNRQRLLRVLRMLERALPPVPEIERELRERRPDLVLITPLVYLGSSQFEVLRTALAMGLRTVFCVGSWDHLSSKALIRDMPHRVLVWNETQKQEAVALHGVPPQRIVITGAQCYDQWFGRTPSRSHEEFCRRVGLPTDCPFILYVCSALFWGSPIEADFVVRWVQSLAESAHPELRHAAVLIRPHPARMDEWTGKDLSAFPHVRLYGSNPVDATSKDDYFESLYYSRAVVGLNTSAFIEGAIVGRPVHTILLPEFHENQEGVLHFQYLFIVGGGVLQAARSFEEHHAQLTASLKREPRIGDAAPGARFVREFVRPHGMEVAATPIFCDAIDEALTMSAPVPERTPARYVLLRWAMYPAFMLLRWLYGAEVFRDDWSRKEREQRLRRDARIRDRDGRRRREEADRRAREQEKAARLARRQSVERARLAERARQETEKASRKRLKVREKAARSKRQRRRQMGARLKHGAARLLRRWPSSRPSSRKDSSGEGQAT